MQPTDSWSRELSALDLVLDSEELVLERLENKMINEQVLNKVATTEGLLNEFVCSNGVILRTRKVKLSIIRDAWKQLRRPKPPIVFIEELDRNEENPADPDYQEQVQEYQLARSDIVTHVYMMMGTDPKFIPENIAKAEDDTWITDLSEIPGLVIPKTGRARYVAWLKYVVLEDENEMLELQKNIMRMSGLVPEEDAKEAEDSFPSN